jgi:hypothetical protein
MQTQRAERDTLSLSFTHEVERLLIRGRAGTQALDYLTRYLDDALVSTGARPSHLPDSDVFFLALARQLVRARRHPVRNRLAAGGSSQERTRL